MTIASLFVPTRRPVIIVLLLLILALTLRLVLLWQGFFPFTWDFGRDMLWVRQLTILHKPMLVGAWGSLDGTYFGPLYFYLLAIFMSIFGGDPRAAVLMVSLFISSLTLVGYWFLRKNISVRAGLIWAILIATLMQFHRLSLYSFPQNVMPFFFFLYFYAQWSYFKSKKLVALFGLGVLASTFFHVEPVDTLPAILVVMVLLIVLHRRDKMVINIKRLLVFWSGCLLPLLPNILFDIRHGFTQTRSFVDFFLGGGQSLGGYLPVGVRLVDRLVQLFDVFSRTVTDGHRFWAGLLIGLLIVSIVWWRRSSTKMPDSSRLLLQLVAFNLTVYWLYFLFFSRLLKTYYLYMMPILILLAMVVWLDVLAKKSSRAKYVIGGLLALIVLGNLSQIYTLASVDATTYRQQQKVVDAIYDTAGGQSFITYSYNPTVYDFPYQYWFSWYGHKKYGYIPVEYAYLPGQPDYVLTKDLFDQNKDTRLASGQPPTQIFLIQDSGTQLAYPPEYWLKQLPQFEIRTKQEFAGGITMTAGTLVQLPN